MARQALKIEDAPMSFGMFLMAMEQHFTYEFGDFFLHSTLDIEKFTGWMLRNGVPQREIDMMRMSVVDYE